MRQMINTFSILVRNIEVESQLGGSRLRCEDCIKVGLKETGSMKFRVT